jgi:hypothetical protein
MAARTTFGSSKKAHPPIPIQPPTYKAGPTVPQIEPTVPPAEKIEPTGPPTEKIEPTVPPAEKIEPTVPPPEKIEPTPPPTGIEPTVRPTKKIDSTPPTYTKPTVPPLKETDSPITPHPPSGDNQPGQEKPAGDIWLTRLNAGIQKLRLQRKTDTTKNITQIARSRNLADEEVTLAIASVWEGLRQNGVDFAYGTTDCFRVNRSAENQVPGMTVVLQPNPLIMPLLFVQEYFISTNKRRHNPVGHLMLVVAERSSALSDDVRIIFMDSSPSGASRPAQRAAAQGLVRYSGWMGTDAFGNAVERNPRFVEEWRPCPRQECGNTCGVSLILNAWAYMLGIPVHPGPRRRNSNPSSLKSGPMFHASGLEIINLALAGHMDSDVIQAFMNYYGYSEDQDPNDASVLARPMQAVRISADQLQQIVENRRLVEMKVAGVVNGAGGAIAKEPEAAPPNPRHETPGDQGFPRGQTTVFAAKDIAALEALGLSHDEAVEGLQNAKGDLQRAAEMMTDPKRRLL